MSKKNFLAMKSVIYGNNGWGSKQVGAHVLRRVFLLFPDFPPLKISERKLYTLSPSPMKVGEGAPPTSGAGEGLGGVMRRNRNHNSPYSPLILRGDNVGDHKYFFKSIK